MAYASWSVVFGEQPSAAKWNILGTNDASFNNGTGIASDAITAAKIDWASTGADGGIWWEELGRTTLGSAGDTLSVTGLGARKYLQVSVNLINSGQINAFIQFNADTGANYAYRSSTNGAADGTATSQTSGQLMASLSEDGFLVIDIFNVAAREKYAISRALSGTNSAAAAPQRLEGNVKWAETSNQITRIDIINTTTGDFDVGSEIVVRGHN